MDHEYGLDENDVVLADLSIHLSGTAVMVNLALIRSWKLPGRSKEQVSQDNEGILAYLVLYIRVCLLEERFHC